MRMTRLLATAAVTALLGAPVAFAQDATPGVRPMPATPAEPPMPGQTPPPAATAPPPVAPPTLPAPTTQTAPAPGAVPAPAAAAAAQVAATPAQPNNVIDVLRAQGNFTTLLSALDKAQLTDTLKSRPAVSIFAPTDTAFAAMSEADRTRLLDPANAQELRQLLLYHVIVADVEDAQVRGHAGPVETAAGARVQLNGTGPNLMADAATVTGGRLDAANGAVFAIDRVLNPAASQAAMGDDDGDAAAAPAATPAASATPAPAAVTPPADETAPSTTPPATTTTTTPPAPGQRAPNGQPAATNTRVAAPPAPNPTDGQVDGQSPRTTPPVQTPDPADGDADGTEPNSTTTPVPVPPTPQG